MGHPRPHTRPPIQAAKNVPSMKEGMLARDVEAPEEQPVASADKPVSSDLRPSNPVHTIQVGPDMAAAADKLHKINSICLDSSDLKGFNVCPAISSK